MPNQFKVMVGTAGLALLLGCGEKQTEVAAPVAEEIGQPAVEQRVVVPPNDQISQEEARRDFHESQKQRIDFKSLRESGALSETDEDKEG